LLCTGEKVLLKKMENLFFFPRIEGRCGKRLLAFDGHRDEISIFHTEREGSARKKRFIKTMR
jgi:hypothetical protein